MSENDAQLELKKRARRRLVGAFALAVLAAIILPMVMDQAPKQPVQDIHIRIPAQDAGAFTSRILPVKPGSAPTPLPPASVPEARPESKPASSRTEVSPGATASKSPETRAAALADVKPPAKNSEEAKPVPKAGNGGQWVVQLGAYRDLANVRNLTAKLKQQGYNFYTEVLSSPDGSSRTRVRAGPFPSKEAADEARERIKRIGVDGVVAEKGA
jgi:DedD protein